MSAVCANTIHGRDTITDPEDRGRIFKWVSREITHKIEEQESPLTRVGSRRVTQDEVLRKLALSDDCVNAH